VFTTKRGVGANFVLLLLLAQAALIFGQVGSRVLKDWRSKNRIRVIILKISAVKTDPAKVFSYSRKKVIDTR